MEKFLWARFFKIFSEGEKLSISPETLFELIFFYLSLSLSLSLLKNESPVTLSWILFYEGFFL